MIRRAMVPVAVLAVSLLVAVPVAGAAKTPKNFFGTIAQTPLGEGGNDDVAKLRDANPGTMRFIVPWNVIQPQAGPCEPATTYNPGTGPGANNCNWGLPDQYVKVASAGGVQTRPYVFGTPGWTKSAKRGTAKKPWVPPVYSKGDKKAWSNFVGAFVDRYGPGGVFWDEQAYSKAFAVKLVQVWNEPSSPAYFAPRPDVQKYATLLKLSATAIRRASKKVDVSTAGVFGTPRRKGGGIDMPDWYKALFRVKGIEKAFDVAAMHPYASNIRGISSQVSLMRRIMRKAGEGRTPLWISEIGWASGGPKGHTLAGTKKSQARRLKQAFSLFKRKLRQWRLDAVSWFSWRDAPEDQSSCASCPFAGLLELDSTEKPAYRAFKKFT